MWHFSCQDSDTDKRPARKDKTMNIFSVLMLFGGLSMFLYGMRLMGDGLKESSSATIGILQASPRPVCSPLSPSTP